jgi:hypothetical protein
MFFFYIMLNITYIKGTCFSTICYHALFQDPKLISLFSLPPSNSLVRLVVTYAVGE